MDFQHHIETAWKLLIKRIVPLLLMTLAMFVLWAVSLGLLAPVTQAGYMQSLLLLIRSGREPRIQDLFSEMRLFLPLLGFSAAVLAASLIGFMFFFLPGLAVVLGVSFFCLYVFPLMTDQGLGVFPAVETSAALSREGRLTDQVIVVALIIGLSAIGNAVVIGTLFTHPLATLFLLSVYEEKIRYRTEPPFRPE